MVIMVFCIFLVSCLDGNQKRVKNVREWPGDYEVDYPQDLVEYFDSLVKFSPATIVTQNVNNVQPNPDSIDVWNSIKALNEYQMHRSKVFPLESVQNALGHLIFMQWHCYSDGIIIDENKEEINNGEIFLFRFIEQVARLCPHVDYLTKVHTGNDDAGIFTGLEFAHNSNPLYFMLLYKNGGGYKVKHLAREEAFYNKIRELKDDKKREYILCYNSYDKHNRHSWYWPSNALVFLLDEGEPKLVCFSKDWVKKEDFYNIPNFCVNFNPNTLTWTKCKKQNNLEIPVARKDKLQLCLDGTESKFVIVE